MAILIPCLVQLRAEFNAIAPARAKGADGWIGDAAHQDRVSDHNPDETGAVPIHDADHVDEVHAIDVTTDLNESDLTMEKCVQFLLGRCRRDSDDPRNEARLRYIIFDRRIWEAPGWGQQTYTGPDPHTGHAHFSAEYITSLEADTASWHLEDIPVALTSADRTWIENTIKANAANNGEVQAAATAAVKDQLADIAEAVMAYKLPGTSVPGSTYTRGLNDMVPDLWQLTFTGKTKGGDPIPEDGVFGQILDAVTPPVAQ
jgi:hypothetical protein